MSKEKLILSIGVLNFLLPFGFVYNIISLLLVLTINMKERFKEKNTLGVIKIFCYFILFLLTSQGFLSLNLILSIFVFDFLCQQNKYVAIGLLLILFETSLFQNTISFLFSNSNYSFIGFLIPNILFLILFFLVNRKLIPLFYSSIVLVVITIVLFKLNLSIFYLAIITSFVTLFFILINIQEEKSSVLKKNSIFFFIFSLISLASFMQFNIGSNKNSFYFLPSNLDSYEGNFFRNYSDALEFSGKKFDRLDNIKDLTDNSLVLIPWISNTDKVFLEQINALKKTNKKATIILAGEHTNYQGSREIINELVGKSVLNDDLTVPRENSNYSGYLRSIDYREWPKNSILNRGASTTSGLFDKTLLSGDLWFSEPNIHEWLWVGDYNWQPTDKIGRLPLATLTKNNNLTFLIFGDNSFLLNSQIIADPTALIRLIELSTIVPLIINDLIILLIIIFYILSFKLSIIIIGVIFSILSFHSMKNESLKLWRYFYIGQSGFDENNFNKYYLDISEHLKDYHIIRTKYLNKDIFMEKNNAIIFGLVDNKFSFKDLEINNCFRTGSLNFKNIRIMDGQFCQVNGDYIEIIGDNNKDFIFLYKYNGFNKIIILDRNFLATKAPKYNLEYLKNLIGKT